MHKRKLPEGFIYDHHYYDFTKFIAYFLEEMSVQTVCCMYVYTDNNVLKNTYNINFVLHLLRRDTNSNLHSRKNWIHILVWMWIYKWMKVHCLIRSFVPFCSYTHVALKICKRAIHFFIVGLMLVECLQNSFICFFFLFLFYKTLLQWKYENQSWKGR